MYFCSIVMVYSVSWLVYFSATFQCHKTCECFCYLNKKIYDNSSEFLTTVLTAKSDIMITSSTLYSMQRCNRQRHPIIRCVYTCVPVRVRNTGTQLHVRTCKHRLRVCRHQSALLFLTSDMTYAKITCREGSWRHMHWIIMAWMMARTICPITKIG